MSDIPDRFDGLEAAAEYVLSVHYRIRHMVRTGRIRNRVTMGTELAGVMLAKSVISLERRYELRVSAQAEVDHRNAADLARIFD